MKGRERRSPGAALSDGGEVGGLVLQVEGGEHLLVALDVLETPTLVGSHGRRGSHRRSAADKDLIFIFLFQLRT